VNSIFGNHIILITNTRLKLYLKSAKQLTQVYLQSKSSRIITVKRILCIVLKRM